MRISVKSIILVFLMLALSLSVVTNSLNSEVEIPTLDETVEPLNVILPIADLNVPGFQEGSIFTDTTLSSGGYHTCAILDNGSVSCWGYNGEGQLGDGTTTVRTTPNSTSSLGTGRTAVAISSGEWHACALLDDGSVSCWGKNNDGQLGDGTTIDRLTPTQTSNLGTGRTAVAISSGYAHTCAILDDGSVSCWGWNNYGQLGDGTTTDRSTPTQTSSLGTGRTAVAIYSAYRHTCIILDDGTVSCWGANGNGQLGDGTTTDQNSPTQTSSLGTGRTAVAISSGFRHTCAIIDDGYVSCWGGNDDGQLGDGTTTDRSTPTQTSSLGTGRTAVAISSGKYHTCAVLDNASVSCWGSNNLGLLGDGTTTNRATPTQTSSLGTGRTAVAISSGTYHTCAILDDGSVSCWGHNILGELGDGTTTDRNSPTQTSSLGTGRTAAVSERDLDDDGILNIFDLTPVEIDSDGDGVGDNSDAFPNDPNENTDSDGDDIGNNADAFPNDANETMDSDGDGVGNNADIFPNDANETVDFDGDGVGDNSDAFPNDVSETVDSDGDGVGDNSDAFPNDVSETVDSDGDGVGDNSDAFPNDPNETIDSDGDGVGDNTDAFPNDAKETMDSDMDGIGDNAEVIPNDGNETVDSDGNENGVNNDMDKDDSSSVPGFTGILGTIALLGAAYIRRNE
jgi:alpha-tubulin suppressor-like RCC1 family protein